MNGVIEIAIQMPTRIPETKIPEFTRILEKMPTTELFLLNTGKRSSHGNNGIFGIFK